MTQKASKREIRRRRLSVDHGVELICDETGPPDGDGIILLHGGGQTRGSWQALQTILTARGMRTLTVDQRGHGESSWAPDGNYTLDAFARDLKSIVDQMGGRPALVGASLGGLASIIVLGEWTPPCRALVLVDVTHRHREAGASKIRDFMLAHPDGFSSLEAAGRAVSEYLPHRKPPRSLAGLKRNLIRGEDGRWRWHWDPAFLNGDRGRAFNFDEERLREALPRIRVPTLLLHGEKSEIVSAEAARELVQRIPDARLASLPDANHMIVGDDNDPFMSAIADFLESVGFG